MPNDLNNKNRPSDKSLSQTYMRLLAPHLNIRSISTRTDIDLINNAYNIAVNPSKIAEQISALLPQLLNKFLTIEHFDEITSVNFKHFIRLLNIGQIKNEQLNQAAAILDKIARSNTSLEVINKIIANFFNLFNYRIKDNHTSTLALSIVDVCIQTIQCDQSSHENIFYILGRFNSFLTTKASTLDQQNRIKGKIFQLLKQSKFSHETACALFDEFLSTGRLRHGETYMPPIVIECIAVGVDPTICQSAEQAPVNSTLTTISWNTTRLSTDESTETKPNYDTFPRGSKLATSFGLGLFAGSLDTMGQLLLHIARRKGCSISGLRLLKFTLIMANTLAISSLPFAYAIVENIVEENNPLITSDKIKLFAYTFMTSLFLQGIGWGSNYLWKNYATKKITIPFFSNLSQFFFNLLPFLACFWMTANAKEDLQEGLYLAGSNLSGAMIPPLVTRISLCFFSKPSSTKKNRDTTPLATNLAIAMTSQNTTLFAHSSPRIDQDSSFSHSNQQDNRTKDELRNDLMRIFNTCEALQDTVKKKYNEKNMPEKKNVISLLMLLKGLFIDERLTTSNDKVILNLIEKTKNYSTELENTVSNITNRKIAGKLIQSTQQLSQTIENIYKRYQALSLYDKLPPPRPVIINDQTKGVSPSLDRQ